MMTVAEIGINHNGSMGTAKALIDLAVKHRFDFVKFQKRDIESCYTKDYFDSTRELTWGTTRRDQIQGLEFSLEQYQEIDSYCKQKGISWYYSPWDVKSAKEMSDFRTLYIKIAHASINNTELRNFYNSKRVPLIVSANWYDQLDKEALARWVNKAFVLACSSIYPSLDKQTGVETIQSWGRFLEGQKLRVGFSNHSPNWLYPVIASFCGAEMIEVHITLDKEMYGSDQKASLDDNDLSMFNTYKYSPMTPLETAQFLGEEGRVLAKLRQTW
jgi:N-acetylneuraminate synthase